MSSSITLSLDDDASLIELYADRDSWPRKRKSITRSRVQPTRSRASADRGRPRGGIFVLATAQSCQPLLPSAACSIVSSNEGLEEFSTLVLPDSQTPERQTSASAISVRHFDYSTTSTQNTLSTNGSRDWSSSSATKRMKVKKSMSASSRFSNKGLAETSVSRFDLCTYQEGNQDGTDASMFEYCSPSTISPSQSSTMSGPKCDQPYKSVSHTELDSAVAESVAVRECNHFCGMPHHQHATKPQDQVHDSQAAYTSTQDRAIGDPADTHVGPKGCINTTSWLEDDSASDDSESEVSVAFWKCEGISEPLAQETSRRLELAITISPSKPQLVDIPQRTLANQDSEDLPLGADKSITVPNPSIDSSDSKSAHKALSLRIPTFTPPGTPTQATNPSPRLEQKSIPRLNRKLGLVSLPNVHVETAPTPPTTPEKAQAPSSTIDLPTVLTMLEAAIRGFPFTGLHLEAPVTHLIRNLNSTPPVPTTAMSPSPSGITWPYSPSFGSNQYITSVHSPDESTTFQLPAPSSDVNERHLPPLRQLFPNTEDFFRSDLYAHFLALKFIDNLPSAKLPLPFIAAMPEITSPKALKMLGIAPLRPEKESIEIRVGRVKRGLMDCIGRLMEAMCGKGRGEGGEALVALVSQIVTMVEEGKTCNSE
ncbi:MAG: hypothetical protein M1835_001499 [Candelina submexicana]|nr:MAG: hypothetical protein M1835_001499 [Candelina submexicana]